MCLLHPIVTQLSQWYRIYYLGAALKLEFDCKDFIPNFILICIFQNIAPRADPNSRNFVYIYNIEWLCT